MAKKQIPKDVLFVCSGNTCRSPMAEHLLKAMAKERKKKITASSRGMSVGYSKRSLLGPAEDTCDVVLELYPDSEVYLHEPTELTFRDLASADIVLTMEERHVEDIIRDTKRYIDLTKKVFTLREATGIYTKTDPPGINLTDPIGGGRGFSSSSKVHSSSKGWSQGISFDLDDHEQMDGNDSFTFSSSNYDQKRNSGYIECRDVITECLDVLLSGKMLSPEEIFRRRVEKKDRIIVREELKEYTAIINDLNSAKDGETIYLEGELIDEIKNPPTNKPYLEKPIELANRLIANKNLILEDVRR